MGKGKRIDPRDLAILAAAETLLQVDYPDRFDFRKLCNVSGLKRQFILSRFPFPELLTLGVMVMIREDRHKGIHESMSFRICPKNGQELLASGWEPEQGLLSYFSSHPLVKLYMLGEPPLQSWFKISGKVC